MRMIPFKGRIADTRPVTAGRLSCICDWLRDATSLDSGDQSWICNVPKVICYCASQRGICDFLLTLNSNVTSLRSLDIMPTSLVCTYPTFLPGGAGKRQLGIGKHALMSLSGCPKHWTIQL